MAKMAQNFQNFRHFFDFCTNHERSNFGIKKSTFFFLEKLPKFGWFLRFFENVTIKFDRAKTAADWRRTGWCFWKSEKLPKFVQFRRFFTSFSNFQKTNFCTYHERSNFGIKKSTFFLLLEILPTFCEYLPFFTTILKESQEGGGAQVGSLFPQIDTFNSTFF